MAGEGWRRLPIDHVKAPGAGAIAIGPFGSRMKSDRYEATGVPVIRGNNISDTRALTGDFAYVSHATADELRASNVFPGDLVFPHRGAIGRVGIVPSDGAPRYMLSTSLMKLTCDPAVVDPAFLFYFFRSGQGRHELLRNASTVGTPGIGQPLASLRSITVPVPPTSDQRAIAHILGTLDDKIELNRRMNETLEAIARALFKSWFVDFDPVRAKSEGRDVGLPPHLADLFPDSFEESELGEIPKGWPALALADCVDAARGLSYKGSGLSDSGKPMHNLNSIYEGGGYKPEGIKHYDGDHKSHHLARVGDVIVANTEQGHNRRLIGYAALVPGGVGDESLFSHHLYRLRPSGSCGLTPDYLCHLLNTGVMHDTVSGYANGTTVNMLPIDGVRRPLVVVPSSGIVRAFDGLAAAARLRHEKLIDESRTIAALRNTLLPKLISGELRVADAERVVEAAL